MFILLPYLGVHSVCLKRKLNNFLGKIYPNIDFKFVFQSTKRIDNFFPFKNRVMLGLLLFTSSRVVVGILLIIVKHHTILLLDPREYLGVSKKGKN